MARAQRACKLEAIRRLAQESDSESEDEDLQDENEECNRSDESDTSEMMDLEENHDAASSFEPTEDRVRGGVTNDLTSKDGSVWQCEVPVLLGRRDASNVLHSRGGPKSTARKSTLHDTWLLFFTEEILSTIIQYSNSKAEDLNVTLRFDVPSLKAVFGLLYFRGASLDQQIPVRDLFSEAANSFYRTVMSRNDLITFLSIMTFDDKNTRSERKRTDKFAAFREVFEMWNENLPKYFTTSGFVTIDEQLIASRCRSPNRIFNPKKPGKFGELVRWMGDAEYRYFYRANPLTKRPDDHVASQEHKDANKVINVVDDLLKPFHRMRGINVTGDRFFSSFRITEKLLHDYKMTYIGTMQQNRREIPPILHKHRENFTSKFVFGGNDLRTTMVAYQATRQKNVIMISTLHHDAEIDDQNDELKPSIICDYNRTKSGIDVVDKMAKRFTTRCSTRRWTMVHLQNLLDVTAINVSTIFNIFHPNWHPSNKKRRRRYTLIQLARELVMEHTIRRLRSPVGLHKNVIDLMIQFTGNYPQRGGQTEDATNAQSAERQRCVECKKQGRTAAQANRTKEICSECCNPVCGKHSCSRILCNSCVL